MKGRYDVFERLLGPRPGVTFVIADQMVAEIWVAGRAPRITLRDYDWAKTDGTPYYDSAGVPFTPITWSRPAWQLGLSLHPPIVDRSVQQNIACDCSRANRKLLGPNPLF